MMLGIGELVTVRNLVNINAESNGVYDEMYQSGSPFSLFLYGPAACMGNTHRVDVVHHQMRDLDSIRSSSSFSVMGWTTNFHSVLRAQSNSSEK